MSSVRRDMVKIAKKLCADKFSSFEECKAEWQATLRYHTAVATAAKAGPVAKAGKAAPKVVAKGKSKASAAPKAVAVAKKASVPPKAKGASKKLAKAKAPAKTKADDEYGGSEISSSSSTDSSD